MRRAAGVAVGLLLASSTAFACGQQLGPGAHQLDGDELMPAFATTPKRPVIGQHFALDIVLCPRGNAPLPAALRVDAHMPAHRHGMNYRPSVSLLGPGSYRAEGLMFHMPGQWELLFELVDSAGKVMRLTQTMAVE